MTPLYVASPDTMCPVCFDETSVIRFKFHNSYLSQRVHSICVDCAFLIFKNQFRNEGVSKGSILCPECRKVTYIRSSTDTSQAMLLLVCLVSFVFFLSKNFVEPKFVLWGRFFNPNSIYSLLIDQWNTCSPGHPLWFQIEGAIENLILAGEEKIIRKELFSYQNMVSIAEFSCLIALYLAAYIKLKLQRFNDADFKVCHRALITTIGIFAIYNLVLENTRYSSLAHASISLMNMTNPLRISPLSTDISYLISHFSVACFAMLSSIFHLKEHKKSFSLTKGEFVRAILDGDLSFSEKSF